MLSQIGWRKLELMDKKTRNILIGVGVAVVAIYLWQRNKKKDLEEPQITTRPMEVKETETEQAVVTTRPMQIK